ncbi:uncharacterized protein SAPINGB_P002089 [Magnusiomyces paraingens]|uniref:5'-deoxynucleotidase n=1 Tax=Magnusiomyces paraingens TaxID=2606893 RepID=A0A5E8BCP3_9ASCO|nr:uncharacterized protein SAPINGB_P002089 [Saprochaete ingens]VVT49071.1 unnamed protein product [Saprochaete ingens]
MSTQQQQTFEEPLWTPENAVPEIVRQRIELIRNSAFIEKLNSSSTPSTKGISNLLIFLHILQQLKKTRRTGWLNFDVEDPESIADHMYRMGIISMLSNNKDLDTGRCVCIALVHDMAESLVGDITPKDPVPKEEKHRRELAAMEYLTKGLIEPFNPSAAQEILDLWNEYENVASPEARFVKDVDKFELLVQTLEFEQQHEGKKDLAQFLDTRQQIKTPEVSEWADTLLGVREDYWVKVKKDLS